MVTSSRNVRHAFRVILKEEGGLWSGCLYRGIFPTLCGIAPYVGLNFAVYETLKGVCVRVCMLPSLTLYLLLCPGHVMCRLLDDGDNRQQVELDSELPIKWKLACGAVAGAVGQSGSHVTLLSLLHDLCKCHMTVA